MLNNQFHHRLLGLLFLIATLLGSTQGFSQHKADTILANQYYSIADSLYESANYDTSIIYFQRAASLYQKAALWEKCSNCYNRISENYLNVSQHEKSLSTAEKALKISHTNLRKNNKEEAFAYNNIGQVHTVNGKYDLALAYFEKAMRIRKEILKPDDADIGESFLSMGYIHFLRGDYDQALTFLTNALTIHTKAFGENHARVGEVYNELGLVYIEKGDYDLAISFYKKALNNALKTLGPEHPYIAVAYNNLGAAHKKKGDFDLAISYYDKSLNIKKKIFAKNNPGIATSYNNIGLVYSEKGDNDRALAFLNRALAIRLENFGELHPLVAISYNNIANSYEKKHDYKAALMYHSKALDILIKTVGPNHPDVAMSYTRVGTVYDKVGDYTQSLAYFQKSLIANVPVFNTVSRQENPVLKNYLDPNVLLRSLAFKGQVLQKLFDQTNDKRNLESALKSYQSADTLIQQIRRSHRAYSDKITAAKVTAQVYEGAIQTCLSLYAASKIEKYIHHAFYFSERSKAGVLRETLSDISAKNFGFVPDGLLRLEKEMKLNASSYQSKIQQAKAHKGGYDTLLVKEYENRLFLINHIADSLIHKLEVNYPGYYDLKYKSEVIAVNDLQEQLPKGAALIDYFEGDSNVFIFSITRHTINYYSFKKDSVFKNSIRYFSDGLKNNVFESYCRNAFYLYNALIKPLLKEKDVSELIIIPDGTLCYLPFESLIQSVPVGTQGFKDLNYLINNFTVTYHYSADLLVSRGSYQRQVKTFLGYAPDATVQGILPSNKEEVKGIASMFGGVVSVGTEATESHFKKQVLGFDIVHLASHTEINHQDPIYSQLFFSSAGDTIEDGILHTYELYNLKMTANLITLSACNTGTGKFNKGEGMMSMARGFMYAGVPNLVMSLWKVSDEPTKDIMSYFYEEIEKGTAYGVALRNAKLRYIKENDNITANPRYWSSFVFVGDPGIAIRTILVKWIWMGSVLVLLLLILVAVRLVRSKVSRS